MKFTAEFALKFSVAFFIYRFNVYESSCALCEIIKNPKQKNIMAYNFLTETF